MTAAAEAYDRHVGRYGRQLAAGLIGAAAIRPGQRLLDVGCGPGALTRELAAIVGAEHVSAIDPSPAFVRACRARVPGAEVQIGVAGHIPLSDNAFDAVVSQLVVPLIPDRQAGVREMARVTRPGGTVAACVWDAANMPLLQAFWDAALDVAPAEAGRFGEGERIGFRDPELLATLWSEAGLVDVATDELLVTAHYDDFDDLFTPFTSGTGNSGTVYRELDAADQRRVRNTAARLLGDPEGQFTLTARAWLVRGTVGEQRRGRDSNPRTRLTPVTRFPVVPVQPLRHLSWGGEG